jgi:apolipoprotein N-acyltransferase
MNRVIRPLLFMAVAAVAGIALSAAYAPFNVWWLAPVSIALLVGVQWKSSVKRGLVTGFIFGFASFFSQHMWLGVVGTDAHWLLSTYLALWIAAVGAGTSYISSRVKFPLAIIGITTLWVLEEAVRGRFPFGGYPWARIVFSQSDAPLVHWSAIAGAPFVTAIVVLLGAFVAATVLRPTRKALTSLIVVVLLCFIVPLLSTTPRGNQEVFTVAVVQGGTPQTGMGAMDVRRAVLENHVRETILLANKIESGEIPRPDLILWPENSTDIDPYKDLEAFNDISTAARAAQAPILVGAVVDSLDSPETEVYNMGILWDPIRGPGETYIKNAPVPFGEFIPFRSLLTRFIERYERVPRDFVAGQSPGIFDINGTTVGDLICFEVAVDPVVNSIVRDGAALILVQTNNATYADTALPEQQLNIERIRSIEMGRAVVVAATTGISAAIAPDGSVETMLPDGAVGSFIYEAPVIMDRTLGSLFGPTVEMLMCILAVLVLIATPIRQRLSKDR